MAGRWAQVVAVVVCTMGGSLALALDETFPTDVAGIRFGQPVSRVQRACTEQGGAWVSSACELGSGPEKLVVTAEGCRGRRVCRVSLYDTERFPAEDVAGWVGRFQARRATLTERYGEPTVHRSRPDCARAVLDASDATCVVTESGTSVSVAYLVGGGRVVLRLFKNSMRRSLQIEERYESPASLAEEAVPEARTPR